MAYGEALTPRATISTVKNDASASLLLSRLAPDSIAGDSIISRNPLFVCTFWVNLMAVVGCEIKTPGARTLAPVRFLNFEMLSISWQFIANRSAGVSRSERTLRRPCCPFAKRPCTNILDGDLSKNLTFSLCAPLAPPVNAQLPCSAAEWEGRCVAPWLIYPL